MRHRHGSRRAQNRYDDLVRGTRERARRQLSDVLRRDGVVGASDIGLAEVSRRIAEQSQVELEARVQLEELLTLLAEEERNWRSRTEARRQTALESASKIELLPDLRDDPSCVAEVKSRLRAWLELRALGQFQPIDALFQWRPCDFFVLRMTMRDDGGGDAYQDSMHWKITREAQRVVEPRCERCGAGSPFLIHTHHLHYVTLGAEREGIDLVSLCEPCHMDGEHERFSAVYLARGASDCQGRLKSDPFLPVEN